MPQDGRRSILGVMTTNQRTTVNSVSNGARPSRPRWHRVVGTVAAATLALGAVNTTFGISTSPGRAELAIPGIRGTGGGGGS